MARLSLIGLAAALAVGCQGASPSNSEAQPPATTREQAGSNVGAAVIPRGSLPAEEISQSRRTAITTAVERVSPAVVTVQTESVERVPADMMEMFFGGRSGERTRAGIGSGFIVQSDGVIVTNAHVVSGASRITVALPDGTTYDATLVGEDDSNDLAVLRIDATNLPVAAIGTATDLLVGEWSIAIGNPFGFLLGNAEPSVSVGVISAVGRNLTGRGDGGGVYLDMLQTDAAINPGNSGGPLVNANGEVIGVNSSIYSPSGGSVGLGFAIPINRAMRIVDDLLTHGSVRQPWVGVQLQMSQERSVRDAARAAPVVDRVVPSSPAQRAGVRVGDLLLRAGDRVIRNPFDWEAQLLGVRVGETLPLTVRRGDRELELAVQVADTPEMSAPRVTVLRELELVTVTAAIQQERRIQNPGALVVRASDRVQQEIGLQSGDVIVQIGNTRITTADLAARAIDAYGSRGPVRLWYERGGRLYPPLTFRVR